MNRDLSLPSTAPRPARSQCVKGYTAVIDALLYQMKPKAIAKARADLLGMADRLETWKGCRLPGPNVVPIRGSWNEQARVSEARRAERAEFAAEIRFLLERCL